MIVHPFPLGRHDADLADLAVQLDQLTRDSAEVRADLNRLGEAVDALRVENHAGVQTILDRLSGGAK